MIYKKANGTSKAEKQFSGPTDSQRSLHPTWQDVYPFLVHTENSQRLPKFWAIKRFLKNSKELK